MAQLNSPVPLLTDARLRRSQFLAIGRLRWRIFVNSLLRRKGGTGELVGRILLAPLLLALLLGPTFLAGFFAWAAAEAGYLGRLIYVFWGAFVVTQLININLGQPGSTFDPTELIRFPLKLTSYVLVRLAFGLLSPANVAVALMSVAIFAGVAVALPALWPWALAITMAFALANVLFTRMVFAWVDRWLSTRRAREVFTALVFAVSLGFQYVNVTYNPGLNHGAGRRVSATQIRHAQGWLRELHPVLAGLPPTLAATALVAAHQARPAVALRETALILLYAGVFLAVYTVRMQTEHRGENLSDQANAVTGQPPAAMPVKQRVPSLTATPAIAVSTMVSSPRPAAILGPLFGKEVLLLRRNTGLLYGIVAPTVMVFLFAGRLSAHGSPWVLHVAIAYTLLSLAPMSFNVFGLEGAGAQLYFMAPVPLRKVFFAKNLLHFSLGALEIGVVLTIVAFVAGRPTFSDACFVLFWAAGTLLITTTVGNLRSVSAPKRVKPGRSLSRNQSQVSVWIALGLLAATSALGASFLFLGSVLHRPWVGVACTGALAVAAAVLYRAGLHGVEAYALQRREVLFEELGK